MYYLVLVKLNGFEYHPLVLVYYPIHYSKYCSLIVVRSSRTSYRFRLLYALSRNRRSFQKGSKQSVHSFRFMNCTPKVSNFWGAVQRPCSPDAQRAEDSSSSRRRLAKSYGRFAPFDLKQDFFFRVPLPKIKCLVQSAFGGQRDFLPQNNSL